MPQKYIIVGIKVSVMWFLLAALTMTDVADSNGRSIQTLYFNKCTNTSLCKNATTSEACIQKYKVSQSGKKHTSASAL